MQEGDEGEEGVICQLGEGGELPDDDNGLGGELNGHDDDDDIDNDENDVDVQSLCCLLQGWGGGGGRSRSIGPFVSICIARFDGALV